MENEMVRIKAACGVVIPELESQHQGGKKKSINPSLYKW